MSEKEAKEPTRVTELVGEKYTTWEPGDYVYINADMGTGKTYFVVHVLAPYAEKNHKRILYLCNRTELEKQVNADIAEVGAKNIDVLTYQNVEYIFRRRKKTSFDITDLSKKTDEYIKAYENILAYDYIVADEFHYFFEDASFNEYTHYVYDYLLQEKTQIKILVSATGILVQNEFMQFIKQENIFDLNADKSYMTLLFYKDNISLGSDYVKRNLEGILQRDDYSKAIYFTNTKRRMSSLCSGSELIKDNSFCMYSTPAKKEAINDIIKHVSDDLITFDKRILMTTSVLCNGITIKDKNIRFIFCDIEDIITAVQCIGRKRVVDEEDKCYVLVRYRTLEEMRTKYMYAKAQLTMIEVFENDYPTFLTEIGDFVEPKPDFLYFDWIEGGRMRINSAKKQKHIQTINLFEKLMELDASTQHLYDDGYAYSQVFKSIANIPQDATIVHFENRRSSLLDDVYALIKRSYNKKMMKNDPVRIQIDTIRKELGMTIKQMDEWISANVGCTVQDGRFTSGEFEDARYKVYVPDEDSLF